MNDNQPPSGLADLMETVQEHGAQSAEILMKIADFAEADRLSNMLVAALGDAKNADAAMAIASCVARLFGSPNSKGHLHRHFAGFVAAAATMIIVVEQHVKADPDAPTAH